MKKISIVLLLAVVVLAGAPQKAHAGIVSDAFNFVVSIFVKKPAPVIPRYAAPNTPQDSLYYNAQDNLYYDTPPTSATNAQPVNPNQPRVLDGKTPSILKLNKQIATNGEKVALYASNISSDYQYYIYAEGDGFSTTLGATPSADKTYLTFYMPKDEPAGNYKLTLRVYSGSTLITKSQNKVDFILSAPQSATTPLPGGDTGYPDNLFPTIKSLSRTSAPIGETVTISPANLTSAYSYYVYVDGGSYSTTVATKWSTDHTKLLFKVPQTATGKVKILLRAYNSSVLIGSGQAVEFTIEPSTTPSPTPTITPDTTTSNTTVVPLVISGTSVVQVVPGDNVTVYAKGTQTDLTYYIYLVGNGFSNTVGLTPVSQGVFSFKVPVEPAGPVELYLRGYKGSTLISQSQVGASITINTPVAASNAPVISRLDKASAPAGEKITMYASNISPSFQYYIYLEGAGFSNTVGTTISTDGTSVSFAMPKDEPAGAYKLTLRMYSGSNLVAESSNKIDFTITAPVAAAPATYPFVLSAPVAGQTWTNGNGYAIQFYGGSATDHLKVDFVNSSTGAVTSVRADVAPMPSIQSTIFFEVPTSLPAGSYNVKITNLTTGQVIATSPVVTVAPPPAGVGVVVQSATYPITYKGGDIIPIFISASNYPAGTTFDVKLATRALTAGSTIVPGITLKSGITGSGNATFNWQVPTSLASANNYLILVCPSTGTECGHSLTFTISNTTPSPTGSPVSEAQSHNFMANVFYSVGEALDSVF